MKHRALAATLADATVAVVAPVGVGQSAATGGPPRPPDTSITTGDTVGTQAFTAAAHGVSHHFRRSRD